VKILSANFSAKMEKQKNANLPKYKWEILDEQRAKDAKVGLLTIDEETTLLQMNVKDIPANMTVLDWIELLEKTGIIFCQR
jgi:hypothetical protein